MRNATFSGVVALCLRGACRSLASLLLAFSAMAFLFTGPFSVAQDSKTPAVLPAPSAGKAIVCIYRCPDLPAPLHTTSFISTTLISPNSSTANTRSWKCRPGTVVIAGLPKMYYGSIIMSAGAALNEARKKENERARFEAEAGKTYYFKWTAGTMATMIKVTPEDPWVGAKEMSKLHLSKPPDDKDVRNQKRKTPTNRQRNNIAPAE